MAIQTVSVGTTPNDGTGDPARTAFIKINDNFTQPENAASRLVATPAEALAGTAGVLPDAEQVRLVIAQDVTSTLGTAATRNVTTSATDATEGRLLKVGDFGLGGSTLAITDANLQPVGSSVPISSPWDNLPSAQADGTLLSYGRNEYRPQFYIPNAATSRIYFRQRILATWTPWVQLRHTGNTTVDPNGFIKAASPIVSLYRDRAESNGSAELEEMQFERIATGHYRLTGVPELSRDGWYIETPKDRNGNVYFTLDYVESEGQLDIKTYTPDYSTGRAENGAPVDIIDGRFVSLRFAASPETTPPAEA